MPYCSLSYWEHKVTGRGPEWSFFFSHDQHSTTCRCKDGGLVRFIVVLLDIRGIIITFMMLSVLCITLQLWEELAHIKVNLRPNIRVTCNIIFFSWLFMLCNYSSYRWLFFSSMLLLLANHKPSSSFPLSSSKSNLNLVDKVLCWFAQHNLSYIKNL